MSNFIHRTQNHATGEFEEATWIDLGVGRGYSVRFPSGHHYRADAIDAWELIASPVPPEREVPIGRRILSKWYVVAGFVSVVAAVLRLVIDGVLFVGLGVAPTVTPSNLWWCSVGIFGGIYCTKHLWTEI